MGKFVSIGGSLGRNIVMVMGVFFVIEIIMLKFEYIFEKIIVVI